MAPKDEPPAPVEIGFLGQETSTFWSEGAEVVAVPEAAADTLASTEPTEASFVAFCRLCERLLATLEPAGKAHFNNRETGILVKKALNDPTSLTPQQRKRFVSAVSKRLDDLSAEVADEFQKSDDHALYTSVVEHFMGKGEPSSKTSEAIKAEPESTEPLTVGVQDSVEGLEAAIDHYELTLSTKPSTVGMAVLGLLLATALPFLLVLNAFESGDDDGLGLCFASILAGLVLIAVAGTKDSAWRKELKLAKERVIKEAGIKAPPRSKTPDIVAGVFAVLCVLAPSLQFYYSDVMAALSFVVAGIAVVVVLAQESERNKVVDRNFKAIVEHRGNEQE